MARSTMPDESGSAPARPKKSVTPPKGRPTRRRDGTYGPRRVFGPVAQWTAAAVLLLLLFAVLLFLTDGGDFNPFNDGQTGAIGAIGQSISIGSVSHWM